MMTTHRHVCACGEDWICTKRDCDIPGITDCTRCAQNRLVRWARSSGYLTIDEGEDHDERQRRIPE